MEHYSKIVNNGQFFYPASNHYTPGANVICNKCNKTNLISCIGYESSDLCLICADLVVKYIRAIEESIPFAPQQPYYSDSRVVYKH